MQSIIFILLTTLGLSLTYPVFGTKRYHRANFVAPGDIQALPMYPSVPQYFDNSYKPQYLAIPSSQLPSSSAYPMQMPSSPNGFLDDSNYYYLPHPEQYRYGLPTYHGEYKPTPYYYAPGPSYSYSDDRLEIANPLDDLHEEIMHEDERDRVNKDIMSPIIGQETWYQNPSRASDSLANTNAAFIRNLILYNNRLNNMHEARKHPGAQLPQQLQQMVSPNEHMGEYDDYEETDSGDWYNSPTNPQLQMAPQQQIPQFQLPKVMPPQGHRVQSINHHEDDDEDDEDDNDDDEEDDNDSGEEDDDEDDEEVKELKSLTNKHHGYHHQQQRNHQQLPQKLSRHQPQPQEEQFKQQMKLPQLRKQPQLEPEQYEMKTHYFNDQQDWQSDGPAYNAYDTYPEYEEDSWINWDRKRNVQPKKDSPVFEYNVRKPSVNSNHKLNSATGTEKPSAAEETSTSTAMSAVTTTHSTGIPTTKQLIQFHMHKGQKEVVLPRPSNPLRHFSEPAVKAITRTEQETKRTTNKSGNIYDTIKQIIAMEQNLEKVSQTN